MSWLSFFCRWRGKHWWKPWTRADGPGMTWSGNKCRICGWVKGHMVVHDPDGKLEAAIRKWAEDNHLHDEEHIHVIRSYDASAQSPAANGHSEGAG